MNIAVLILSILSTIATSGLELALLPRMIRAEISGKPDQFAPIPFVLLLICNLAYVSYGLHFRAPGSPVGPGAESLDFSNYAVLITNFIGVFGALSSLLLWLSSAKREDPLRRPTIILFIVLVLAWILMNSILWIVPSTANSAGIADANGWVGMITCVLYLASPLLSLPKVIKEKNSAYFSVFFSAWGICSGSLFLANGILSKTIMIAIPNGIGVVLSLIQLTFCIIYKSTPPPAPAPVEPIADLTPCEPVLDENEASNTI